jgi:recombination protein RecR
MPPLPGPLNDLAAALGKLPGIGPRSAERLALHLVQSDTDDVKQLAQLLVASRERIRACRECGGLTENDPCDLCASDERDAKTLCIVEGAIDILRIEKSGVFRGHYHALGGRISPMNGVEPEDLRIDSLERRVQAHAVEEIIIALGADMEGDATSYYLAERLARPGVRITRLAHGLPAGGGLEFADEMTLTKALEGRREF